MRSMECKVCDRTISNEDYFKGNFDPQCKPKPDLVGEFSRALSKAGYITNEGEKQ